jgi:carbon storage regulator
MLVLTRKENEKVVIGNDITITVVSVGPGRVKLGIEAPKWMAIDRQEVHDKKQVQTIDEPVGTGSGIHNRLTEYSANDTPRKPR